MAIEIKVPTLPESVADATVATWHKQPGDSVARDENLVDIETDKVVLEVVAPEAGVLEAIIKADGETVGGEEVIGTLKAGAVAAEPAANSEPAPAATPESKPAEAAPAPAASTPSNVADLSPAVRRMVSEHDIDASGIAGSGRGGRVTRTDVQRHMQGGAATAPAIDLPVGDRPEKRVPMTRLRARVAERLIQAQQTAAILTTFNEIDMKPVMDLRKQYKDKFEKAHGVRLGFMSFFIKAVTEALKRFPPVNASIDEKDIIYHGYYDVGVAVSSPRGLVVPILRDVDQMSMAQIEQTIQDYGQKAKDGKLTVEEMTGGTFTVSNGGVFGSLMSTPILNPPQTGILGMHKIEERAVVQNGEIVVRPMMYVALSYDHRLIDGAESVRFLVTVKELIEDPARLLLEI